MARGGARKGAGRPKGTGNYREPTKPIRIPERLIPDVLEYVQSLLLDEEKEQEKPTIS